MKRLGKMKIKPASAIADSRVSVGFECLDRELFDPGRCYDLLGRSGIKHARCQTGWNRCEKEKGVYDFRWLDDVVDQLLIRGVKPWFNVGFGNPLYMKNASSPTAVGCVPLLYGEEALEAWKNYVAALAAHFRGRVTEYEIWNEPDLKDFWYPAAPDPAQYAALVDLTGEIICRADPAAKIGACASRALPNREDTAGFTWRFLSRVRRLDFFCYHNYEIMPEAYLDRGVAHLRAQLDASGHAACELWNGECGYPSWFPKGSSMQPRGTQGSQRQQAVGHMRYIFLDADLGVKRTSIYSIVDHTMKLYQTASYQAPNPPRWGILEGGSYAPKKTYEALSRIATLLAGETGPSGYYFTAFTGKNTGDTTFIREAALLKAGRPLYAYWRPSHIEEEAPVLPGAVTPLTDGLYDRALREPVLADPLDGCVYALDCVSDRGAVRVLSSAPLADYPLVICERSALELE